MKVLLILTAALLIFQFALALPNTEKEFSAEFSADVGNDIGEITPLDYSARHGMTLVVTRPTRVNTTTGTLTFSMSRVDDTTVPACVNIYFHQYNFFGEPTYQWTCPHMISHADGSSTVSLDFDPIQSSISACPSSWFHLCVKDGPFFGCTPELYSDDISHNNSDEYAEPSLLETLFIILLGVSLISFFLVPSGLILFVLSTGGCIGLTGLLILDPSKVRVAKAKSSAVAASLSQAVQPASAGLTLNQAQPTAVPTTGYVERTAFI